MSHYADSGFLVSCYLLDNNSVAARNWLSLMNLSLPFTDFHGLEVRNAIRLAVFRKTIAASQAEVVLTDIASDISAGRLALTPVEWPAAFRAAIQLSESQTAIIGARSLDILHVGAAKTLGTTEFLSFDTKQRNSAAAAGLRVLP